VGLSQVIHSFQIASGGLGFGLVRRLAQTGKQPVERVGAQLGRRLTRRGHERRLDFIGEGYCRKGG
jgi:hypothetical protein